MHAGKSDRDGQKLRVLLVDLNNFSLYPTIGVGYLAAILRRHGMLVTVLSPLAFGVPGVIREPPESELLGLARRVNFLVAQAAWPLADRTARWIDYWRTRWAERTFPRISQIFAAHHPEEFDVVLVSSYLMYYPVCSEIGRLCEQRGVPLIIGGSYFAVDEVAQSWLDVPGLSALVAGEVEYELCDIVRRVIDREDVSKIPGVYVPGKGGSARPPLRELDGIPFPDYSDFPWHRYPHRLVPIIAGRGCGWGVCNFCSDVVSSSGRTFRSRSSENVLEEIRFQSKRHETGLFVFTDLKLNSNIEVWEDIVTKFPGYCEAPRWVTSVHVGSNLPNGLDGPLLLQARRSGLVRLTTGLESGSQRLLDSLVKGTDLAVTSRFLYDAAAANISTRVTMIHGAPGETPQDVLSSARFLQQHERVIDRVKLNRFMIMIGTTFQRRLEDRPSRYPSVIAGTRNPRLKSIRHKMTNAFSRDYILATQQLLGVVHRINRKQLPEYAEEFNGVM